MVTAILDFRKPDLLAMDPPGLAIFYPGKKFGAKILIEAKIMVQNRNPRWRPSAILDFRIRCNQNNLIQYGHCRHVEFTSGLHFDIRLGRQNASAYQISCKSVNILQSYDVSSIF